MNLSNRAGRAVFVVATVLVASLPVSLSHAQPPPNAVPVNITGEIRLSYMDDFDNERAELQYFILDQQSNRRYRLNFDGEPPPGLATGTPATVVGLADENSNVYLAAGGVNSSGSVEAAGGSASGNQSTLVMVANFNDVAVECPVQDIRDLMFTDPNDQSVDDAYRQTSHGALSLSGEVAGPFDIHYSSGGCSIDSWASATDKAAQAAGVNVNGYSRRVYVLPRNGCGAAGYGDLGGSNTQAWVFVCDLVTAYAHELGHNFGMHHASTPTAEYGDGSDFMGLASRLRHVNGPHKEQMGWTSGAQIQSVSKSGFYDIAPLELDAANALAPQILRIAQNGSGDDYYLSYRRGIGFDVNLSTSHKDRVSIHEYPGDYSASKTYLIGTIGPGESFVDSKLSITLVNRNDDFATIDVNFDGGGAICNTAAPQVTLVPASQSGAAGDVREYDVVVTNQDSGTCEGSSFRLTYSVPAGFDGSIWPPSVTVGPGQSGTAVLSVASGYSSASGTYVLGVDATDANSAARIGHGSGSYVVEGGSGGTCTRAAPQMSLSPGSQTGSAGTTLSYTLSLVNNDSTDCDASTFSLSAGSLPSGWNASLSSQSASLAPGQGTSVALSVTSSTSAAAGTYSVEADASDASTTTHTMAATGTYAVEQSSPTPTEDLEAPTQPTGLSAKANGKRINLSWSASSDNVGVTGYRIYRDGTPVGTAPDTQFSDDTAVSGIVYQYAIVAYDAAGNDSAMSVPVAAELTSNGRGRGNGNGNR